MATTAVPTTSASATGIEITEALSPATSVITQEYGTAATTLYPTQPTPAPVAPTMQEFMPVSP